MKSLYSIYQVISNVQPDILHLFTIKPIIYGGLVNKLLRRGRVPLSVASITGLGSAYLSANLSGKFLWQLIKQAYKFVLSIPTMKIVFENSDDKQMFIDARIINERQAFLVNGAGVNISYFHPFVEKTSNLDLTVVLVARLLKDKGIREYIEAGKIIKEHGVEITLKLVGSIDNDNSSTMQEDDIVEAHNLGYIQYLGHRSDIANIYRQSQIACLPSYREGLPKSLIEAMACGLPIITTDVYMVAVK
ncbi:glycosyltransferase [Shewanella sp. PP-Sp27a-2]